VAARAVCATLSDGKGSPVCVFLLVYSRPSPAWGDAIDVYLSRDQADADLERVLGDEPEWQSFLSVETVEPGAADCPN
jgi:hypothetical protein